MFEIASRRSRFWLRWHPGLWARYYCPIGLCWVVHTPIFGLWICQHVWRSHWTLKVWKLEVWVWEPVTDRRRRFGRVSSNVVRWYLVTRRFTVMWNK